MFGTNEFVICTRLRTTTTFWNTKRDRFCWRDWDKLILVLRSWSSVLTWLASSTSRTRSTETTRPCWLVKSITMRLCNTCQFFSLPLEFQPAYDNFYSEIGRMIHRMKCRNPTAIVVGQELTEDGEQKVDCARCFEWFDDCRVEYSTVFQCSTKFSLHHHQEGEELNLRRLSRDWENSPIEQWQITLCLLTHLNESYMNDAK